MIKVTKTKKDIVQDIIDQIKYKVSVVKIHRSMFNYAASKGFTNIAEYENILIGRLLGEIKLLGKLLK